MSRLGVRLAAGILAALGGTIPAVADDTWAGARLNSSAVYGWGTTTYAFNTAGYYNLNAGDTFSHGVRGHPYFVAVGYDWQSGRIVSGLEMAVIAGSGGISNYAAASPYAADHRFELKFHWAATVAARIGVTTGRMLFYVEGGPAFGHLIGEARDETAAIFVRKGDWPLGINAGAGFEVALGRGMSFNVGYRFLTFAPFGLAGESRDEATDIHQGPATATDHTIQYRAHIVTAGTTVRFGGTRTPAMPRRTAFDWHGAYVGTATGGPIQAHATAGYNAVFAGRTLAGVTARAGYLFCCGGGFTADLLGRIGFIVDDAVVFYGDAGVKIRGGGVLQQFGGGMEIALGSRTSGFMELNALGPIGGGFGEVTFMAGINLQIGRR